MKLTVNIKEINYGDVAAKVMPLLEQAVADRGGAVAMTVSAIARLPESLIYDIFDAIPSAKKNKIIAAFVMEYEDRILDVVNKLSAEQKIGVAVSELSVSEELEIAATVGELDYLCLADRFLPAIKEKLLEKGGIVAILAPIIEKASAEQICGLLDRILGNKKDNFMVALINQNQQTLISKIEDVAEKQNIHLSIHSIYAQE